MPFFQEISAKIRHFSNISQALKHRKGRCNCYSDLSVLKIDYPRVYRDYPKYVIRL